MIKKFTPLFLLFFLQVTLQGYAQQKTPDANTLTVTTSVDINCDNIISESETRMPTFVATLQKGDFSTTLSAIRNGNVNFTNLQAGTYTVSVSLATKGKSYSQSFSVTVNSGDNNYRAIINNHCTTPPEKPKDTVPIIVKPKCGKWYDTDIDVNDFSLVKGDLDIRSVETIIARLKAKFTLNLDYSITYKDGKKDVKEECVILYKIRYPNGRVVNQKGNVSLSIMEPGTYSIEYQVLCNDNNCVSGIKYIRCDEQIVCNCGTPNDQIEVTTKAQRMTTSIKTTRDTIYYNKAVKTWINRKVNCSGNICDGRSSYSIRDAAQNIITSNSSFGRFKPKLNAGATYTLIATDYCGNKNCTTLSYVLKVIDTPVYTANGKSRIGIHADGHLNIVSTENLTKDRVTVNGMLGLIADIPISTNKKLHLWPSLNIVWYRYSGSNVAGSGDFAVKYKNYSIEAAADLSYELYRKNEAALHIYIGAGINFEASRKNSFTGSTTAINTWKLANQTTNTNTVNAKGSIGLLYEINKKWMLGTNYYYYTINNRNDMLLIGNNSGVALRLAYFFNRRK